MMAAMVWIVLSLAVAPLMGEHYRPGAITLTVVYTCVLTPIFEEWLFRGYVLSSLLSLKQSFWVANIITSLGFLAPHFIGWGFQGVLVAHVMSLYPLTIFVLSLVLGYVRHRSGSLMASMFVHMGNNLVSTLFVH